MTRFVHYVTFYHVVNILWYCRSITFLLIYLQLRESAANAEKRLKREMSEWQENVRVEHQVLT